MRPPFRPALVGLLSAIAVLAAACGSETSTEASTVESPAAQSSASADSTTGAEEFNGTDVSFAAHMLPHHERGVTMAELAVQKTQNPEIEALAQAIIDAQTTEIGVLQGFLDTFGAEPAEPAPAVMQMHERKRASLAALSGAEFDRRFLEMMSTHHSGAVTQSEVELSGGAFAEAQSLAEDIKAAQVAEIDQMNQLIAGLG